MIRYAFKDDGPVAIKNIAQADPQVVGEALAALSDASSGCLIPQAVVAAAEDKNSALHPFFEWDDAVAAKSYRLEQARALIRIVRVIDEETEEPVRAFLSIADSAVGGTAYRTVQEVAGSTQLQLAVLRQAERDLVAWEKRYAALRDVCALVSMARERAAEKAKELEATVS